MAQYDDLNVPRIATIGVISILVTAVTALAVQVLFYALADWQDSVKSMESDYTRENAVLAQQAEQISNYGVDPTTGRVTIPIDKAMELVIAENQNHAADKQTTDASNHKNSDET